MMKRTIINMMMVLGSAIAMVSCDTRENVFEDVEKRMIIIGESEDGRIDTLSASPDNVKANLDMYITECGRAGGLYFNTLRYKFFALIDGQKKPIWIEWLNDKQHPKKPGQSSALDTPLEMGKVVGEHTYEIDANYTVFLSQSWFNNDGSAKKLYETTIIIDYLMENESSYSDPIRKAYLNVTVWSENSPVPVLEVKPISGQPMARTLSMKDSYDKDGVVQKYEYCIDGNVMQYTHNDLHFETRKGVWQSGMAAYGGTYITATELSEVNHVFQSKGTHNIYYRCMDDLGAWSKWELSTIEIE